jgi:hypothetical protein
MFTAEDVPPRHRDGRPLVLTCKECNDRGGSQLDVHWAHHADVEAFILGELVEPLGVNFTYAGVNVTMDVTSMDREFHLRVVPEACNEADVRKLEHLAGGMASPSETMKVSLYRSRFSEARACLSVLRAAYLTGFAVTGYRFFAVWDPIRVQLLNPKTIDYRLKSLINYDADMAKERRLLGVIDDPPEMWSVCVGFGRWTAFIPLAADSPFYQPTKLVGAFQYRGHSYEWPTEPSFGRPR